MLLMSRKCMLNNISVYISEPLSRLPTELHNIVHVIQGHIGLYTNRDQYTVEQLYTCAPSPTALLAAMSEQFTTGLRHFGKCLMLSTSLPSLLRSFAATPIDQAMVVWDSYKHLCPNMTFLVVSSFFVSNKSSLS